MPHRLIRRILALVEFAAPGEPDMGYAVGLARQLDAELVLFGVIDRPAMVSLIGKHRQANESPSTLTAALVADAKRILQRIVDGAAEVGVKALGHAMVSDDVHEQILREAMLQHVDLILVPSSTRGGVLRRLLDSTVEEILKAAPCPVLVARS